MNKEEAIKICEGFTICVYEKDPQFFGNMWQVKQDIRSITAVQKLLEEYKKLEEDYKRLLERLGKEVKRNIELSNMSRGELIKMINQLEEENKKIKNMYNHHYKYASDMEGKYVMAKGVTDWLKIWLDDELLDNPNDIFSVVRVKDVLDKIKELEGGSNE